MKKCFLHQNYLVYSRENLYISFQQHYIKFIFFFLFCPSVIFDFSPFFLVEGLNFTKNLCMKSF